MESLLIGLVSISDRASSGVYEDKGIPASTTGSGGVAIAVADGSRLIPTISRKSSARSSISSTTVGCHLVLTTGGTGPAPRDVDARSDRRRCEQGAPGFGEQMRQVSLNMFRPRSSRGK